MEKEILIIKNISREGPGLLEELLKKRRIGYTIIDLALGQNFPPVENFGAVVVLGGPDSANDNSRKMKIELARIREAIDANIPYLGICLGLQTLVKAAGGRIIKSRYEKLGSSIQKAAISRQNLLPPVNRIRCLKASTTHSRFSTFTVKQ